MKDSTIFSGKSAMDFGAIIGIVLTINGIIFYALHAFFSEQLVLIGYIITMFGIFIGLKKHRDSMPDGVISYSKAMGYGTLLIFYASIIYGFFVYLLYKIIDTNLLSDYLSFLESNLLESGLRADNAEAMMTVVKMTFTPFTIGLGEIFTKTLMGFLFTLIISLVLTNTRKTENKGI